MLLLKAGADPEPQIADRVADYVSSQLRKFATLDLAGLRIRFRNGTGPLDILTSRGIDFSREFAEILLDESQFFCPFSLRDIKSPAFSLSCRSGVFAAPLTINHVQCKRLSFTGAIFDQPELIIDELTCETLDLSGIKAKRLVIARSHVGCITLDNAEIASLEIRSSSLGSQAVGVHEVKSGAPGFIALSVRADTQSSSMSISELRLISVIASGDIDIFDRTVTSECHIEKVKLTAPMRVSRNMCKGDLMISDFTTPAPPDMHGSDRRRWERMFTELKFATLHAGDRKTWAEFAVKEQSVRVFTSGSKVSVFLHWLDKHASNHGTDLTIPFIWLILLTVLSWLTFGIIDLISGRWSLFDNLRDFWERKLIFSISQIARPFSAFEKQMMGHPYYDHKLVPATEWLDWVTLLSASLESAACIGLLASMVLALRHHLSPLN
jgi:hypothetical protein